MSYYQKYLKYKNKYLDLKNTNQIGGNPEIILKMRSFKGEYVLVIGSSEDEQKKYNDFCGLPENRDKMIISINLHGKGTNNFELDFNDIKTWLLFEPFNERFSTIIFDFATDKHIELDIDFDIILKIKNLLKIGGKLYKYYSFGNFFIPNDIKKNLVIKEFEDIHLNIILEQFNFNIPENIWEDLSKIKTFKIYHSEYGYHCPDIISLLNELEFKEKSDMDFKQTFIRSLKPYLKSLYIFYNQLSYTYLLEKRYNFDVESHLSCDLYPLKYQISPSLALTGHGRPYKYDLCYLICTKKI